MVRALNRGHLDKMSRWTENLYTRALQREVMSNTQTSKSNTATVAESQNAPAKTSEKSLVKLEPRKFEDMSDEERTEYLQRVIDEKPKTDSVLISERLKKAGVMRIPSDRLVKMTYDVRHAIAGSAMQVLKAGQQIENIALQAVSEGFTPQEARIYVKVMCNIDGTMTVTDKTIRRSFAKHPELAPAIESNKTTKAGQDSKAQREKEMTPEQKEGLKPIILPPAACVAIAKYQKEGCIVYLRGSAYVKVKPKVISETVEKSTNGEQRTRRVRK